MGGRLAMATAGMAAAVVVAAAAAVPALARDIPVSPAALGEVLAGARPGDRLLLAPGRYRGPLVIATAGLVLDGNGRAVIDGGGRGRVITVDAPEVTLTGLVVTGSGASLPDEDSGIFLTDRATGAQIVANRLVDNLIGINVKGAADAVVSDNTVVGRPLPRLNDRGNGIQLWNAPGTRVEHNAVEQVRDGIFVTTSRHNLFAYNSFRRLRFAVHYMYTQDSAVIGNLSRGNHVGYALMYSYRIRAIANRSFGDRDHGLMLNYVSYSEIRDNWVRDVPGKCLFFYNANINRLVGNRFEHCGIGIHFTAGSERNVIAGNAFIANRRQVKYVGTRHLDWSDRGRGNYWSDHPAFDIDRDGIADAPYRPNDIVDRILWSTPEAKLFLMSPAFDALRLVAARLPPRLVGGVIDTAPLMRPPPLPEFAPVGPRGSAAAPSEGIGS